MKPAADKIVVITGASSGIGCATALAFAEAGARVVLAARDEQALIEVAEECGKLGAATLTVPTDVVSAAAVRELAVAAKEFGGRIDVWVNNAGVGAVGAFEQTPIEAHEQVVQTDLLGYIRGAHAVLPCFKRQRWGVLINVQSVGSWVPQPYSVAYSAAKFGLRGFSEALRGELGDYPDIHICDVFPSFVDTPGIRHAANYRGAALRPAPPLLDPRTVARQIVKLAESPRAAVNLGMAGHALRAASLLLPGYVRWSARLVEYAMRKAAPVPRTDGGLFQPPPAPRSIDGGWRDGLSLPQRLAANTAVAALGAVKRVVKRAAPVLGARRGAAG